jgi:hypothetical protein
MGRPTISVEGFWDRPLHELFELLPATPAGLTTEEARRRLHLYGPNSLVHELECPANFVPVDVRQTGMGGAWYVTRKEVCSGTDREFVAAD